jgi:HAD superfamily hydrolase (TIGR01490 family)
MARTAAFFDVDGTLTTERVWRGVLEYYKCRGLRQWTYRLFWAVHTPLFLLYKAGLLSQSAFRKPWARHLAWFIRGESEEEPRLVWDWVAKEYLSPFWRADALELIKQHKKNGDLVILVSAGLTPLEQAIAEHLGADFAVGTQPALRGGRYTGGVAGPVCIDAEKATLAQAALQQRGLDVDLAASTAYADGATDMALLEMVGHPVAFHPDEQLKPIAQARGWKLIE